MNTPTWLYDWGVGLLLWLQGASPALDVPFLLLTATGSELFATLFLPVIYWCVNRRAGLGAALLFGANSAINAAAKAWFDTPRPFEVHPNVEALTHATDPGFPSGHTQGAVTLWGYFAARRRTYGAGRWLTWVPVALIVLVPLSRMYLGVHYPADLIGGYLLGFLVLMAFLWLEDKPAEWFTWQPLWAQLAIAAGIPLVAFALFAGAGDNAVSSLGLLLGAGVGAVLERRYVRFAADGPLRQRVLRYLLGLVLLLVLRFGLKAAFAGLEPAALFRYLRYALLGVGLVYGAPWLFCRLDLAPHDSQA